MIVATDITKAHKWQWLAGLGDVTCRPYRTNGQASWNRVTHRRVRFYKKKKISCVWASARHCEAKIKTLLSLIITKTMGLVIGDRVKVLAHTANWALILA